MTVKDYWDRCTTRERQAIGIASICLIFFIIYQFLYAPLVSLNQTRNLEFKEKSATLSWMQETRQMTQHHRKEKLISAGKLLGIIATELNQKPFSKFPHQIQQTNQGSIQLTFEKVPFLPFLGWLWHLENTYAITQKQFDASRTATKGVAKIMVIIDVNS